MTWYNLSSNEQNQHSIAVGQSLYPLLLLIHIGYVLIVTVFATAPTLYLFLFAYPVFAFIWRNLLSRKVLIKLSSMLSTALKLAYPISADVTIVLSEQGQVVVLGESTDTAPITGQLHGSCLVYWWGCWLSFRLSTGQQRSTFVFQDSVSEQDYARLCRTIDFLHQQSIDAP